MNGKVKIILTLLIVTLTISACSPVEDKTFSNPGQEESYETNEVVTGVNFEDMPSESNIQVPNSTYENLNLPDFRLSLEKVQYNRNVLSESIKDNSILVLFSDFVMNEMKYLYTPNRNLYYYTGLDKANIILVIIKINGDVDAYIFAVDEPEMDKWNGNMLTLKEASQISGINNVHTIETFESFFNHQLENNLIENVYVDMTYNTISDVIKKGNDLNTYLSRAESFVISVNSENKDISISNITQVTQGIRSIKSHHEIENINKAIWITGEGQKDIMKHTKADMMEYEIEAYFDFKVKALGGREHAFPTIAAAGKNATILHYFHNNQPLNDGELLLLDLGASYGYYSSDISRTIPINGKFSDRQKTLYNIVLKAQLKTIESIKPGMSMQKLDNISREVMSEALIKIGFINSEKELNEYYPHGVGHSLGLDTHDPYNYFAPFKPGMVITVEPGLYIEDEGIGIRIEDDILVTEHGYINLSNTIIKTVKEIEEFMNAD